MELAISYAELDLAPERLLAIDTEFSLFEGTARRAQRRGLQGRLVLSLDAGGVAAIFLERAYPTLRLELEPQDSGQTLGDFWRLWRPPPELVPGADWKWLRDTGLLSPDRVPTHVARRSKRRWEDPTSSDVPTILDLVARATSALAEHRRSAA